jgi:anaerobic selenocysteine-containing dehydrogenase
MKLSRRCFLSFVAGGAAGTALSPLPWKVLDDVSIWSQNWPWTPVPPDGEGTHVNSTCTLCPGGCGITVRKIDERAVRIEGAEGHPINDGGICMLGLSGLQLLYGPTRIQGPLKRVGERGQGRFKSITWRQAIKEVADKLAEIRSQGNPQSVGCIAPKSVGTVPQLLNRLMRVYGSPNFFRMPSVEDAYEAVLHLTQGADGYAGLDVENADFILSFGSSILDGYGSPVRMFQANSAIKDKKGQVVQIEPCLSNTAAKADTWLPIVPGTETDLALGIAHVLIAKQLVNRAFVANSVAGFEAFTQMVKERYTPEAVAAKTGIDAKTIEKVATQFASTGNALAICGRGKGQTPGSLKEALAVHALNALVGSIDAVGGVNTLAAYDYIGFPDEEIDQVAAAGLQTTRLDGAGSDTYPHARFLTTRMAQAADGLEALLVAESNPCYSLPNSDAVTKAIEKIPFVVSFSSFMDETAMNADIILPNHLYLERFEDVPVTAGVSRPTVGLCRPVVEPLYNTQHLGDSIIQIAKALKGSFAQAFPWNNYDACLKMALGGKWDSLKSDGVWVDQSAAVKGEAAVFATDSGKFNLMSGQIGAIYMADEAEIEGDPEIFPLVLIPYDSIRLASRYIGDTPFMIKTVSDKVLNGQDGFIDINPETAKKLGFADGKTALLKTPIGRASVRVNYDHGIMPGVVAMPRGLGHTAYDTFLANKGINVNRLMGPVEDPSSGFDAAWGIRAKLA